MIDLFNEIFTAIATPVRTAYPAVRITGEYVSTPASYPAVTIDEIDNTEVERDSGSTEKYNRVRYRCQVFSNKSPGKRAEARAIQNIIDTNFRALRFKRTSYSTTPDVIDNTVYCITTVFTATIDTSSRIHGAK